MKFIKLFFIFLLISTISLAQEQIIPEKVAFVDSSGRYFQQVDLPVYIRISNKADDAGLIVKEERGKTNDPIYMDGHGIHHIRHMDDIHKRVDIFKIYADGIAPISNISYSSNPYKNTKTGDVFYSSNLKIKLSATDEMSGVNKIFYSINSSVYQEYSDEISFNKDGKYKLLYYSTDKTGNAETPKSVSFIVDINPPRTFHNFVGVASGHILSANSRIYLSNDEDISGVAYSFYAFDNEEAKKYNGKEITFTYLETGEHKLSYWSEDNVGNKETVQTIDFFLDKQAPIASIDILGDKFVVDNKVYLSGRTKVKLTAVDNRSGIKELKYSINNQVYQGYTEPFYMPSKSGVYTIQYYANDESGNSTTGELMQSKGVIYVDLLGPELQYSFVGPIFKKKDITYVGKNTKIALQGKDKESGLKRITYSINGGEEKDYSTPFSLNGESGEYKIVYAGYDNVNNRNEENLTVFFDATGPEISSKFSTTPEDDNYPTFTKLFLGATDSITTASDIYYSINGGKEQLATTSIQGFSEGVYRIKIRAKDILDNESEKEFEINIKD